MVLAVSATVGAAQRPEEATPEMQAAAVQMDDSNIFLPLARSDFSFANFVLSKSANPTQLNLEETVTYTVVIRNDGDTPGKLEKISDTLPPGFTFDSMAAGSDIVTAPTGTAGTIVWDAPLDVAANSELTLIYNVKAGSEGGTFVNSVTVTTEVGQAPEAPAEATVNVGPPVLFEDDFEAGIGAWTPYTNHKRASADMWYWDPGKGRDGSACYTLDTEIPEKDRNKGHDALSMYLGEGSEAWTDYRYTAWFKALDGYQVGVWLRGEYRDVGEDGQWLTGYYFSIKLRDSRPDIAVLWQLRTAEEHGAEVHDYYWYHYQNPLEPPLAESDLESVNVEKGKWHRLTVEVRGNNIKGYVDDELAIDHTDTVGSVFRTGTVGFYAYGNERAYANINFDDVKVEPLY
jgi:uncharacterized repeat protein (TIGR01451 family)